MSDCHKTACTGMLFCSLLFEAARNKSCIPCCRHCRALLQRTGMYQCHIRECWFITAVSPTTQQNVVISPLQAAVQLRSAPCALRYPEEKQYAF